MNTTDLAYFKDILLKQRAEILNYTHNFKSDAQLEADHQGDEGDLAVSELNLSMSLHLQERQTHLLQKVDHSLAKIELGVFGLCEQCEEPLHLGRLKARPVAALCISCKEEQERRERVFA